MRFGHCKVETGWRRPQMGVAFAWEHTPFLTISLHVWHRHSLYGKTNNLNGWQNYTRTPSHYKGGLSIYGDVYNKDKRTIDRMNKSRWCEIWTIAFLLCKWIQWNLSITTTQWDIYLPSGVHLGGQGMKPSYLCNNHYTDIASLLWEGPQLLPGWIWFIHIGRNCDWIEDSRYFIIKTRPKEKV